MVDKQVYYLILCKVAVWQRILKPDLIDWLIWCRLCGETDQSREGGDPQRTDRDSLKTTARREAPPDKKRTFRGISKAVSLAAKLSPKSQRKDKAVSNIAELKVCLFSVSLIDRVLSIEYLVKSAYQTYMLQNNSSEWSNST